MSVTTRSPGPWTAQGGEVKDAEGTVIAEVFALDGDTGPGRISRADRNEAAIAAASEMVDRLRVAIDWLADLGIPAHHVEMKRMIETLRKADCF